MSIESECERDEGREGKMCVTFVLLNTEAQTDEWKLIVANNRDEFYDRTTSRVSWRDDGTLCACDERGGGTWLAVDKRGRVAVLLTVLEHNAFIDPNAPTRGNIVLNWVGDGGKKSAYEYAEEVKSENSRVHYNGFSTLLIDSNVGRTLNHNNNNNLLTAKESKKPLVYYCNRPPNGDVTEMANGVYGFGNSVLTRPYRKVEAAVDIFKRTVNKRPSASTHRDQLVESIIHHLLNDRTRYYMDEEIRAQRPDKSDHFLSHYSSCYTEFPSDYRYGTRSQSVFAVSGSNEATFVQRSMVDFPEHIGLAKWETSRFDFTFNTNNGQP